MHFCTKLYGNPSSICWRFQWRNNRHTGAETLRASSMATKPSNIFWQLLREPDIVLIVAFASFVRYMKECFTDTSSCFSEVLLCNIGDSLLKSCTFAIGSSPWSPVHTDRWVEMRSSLPLNHKNRERAQSEVREHVEQNHECWSLISSVFSAVFKN